MKPGMRLLIALSLGLFAGIIAFSALSKKEREVEQRGEPVDVLVAKTKIEAGKQIIPDMIDKRRIPSLYKQPDALTAKEKAIDQVAIVTIAPGEQILESKLSSSLMQPLAAVLPKGMRTVTVQTDATKGAAGLIQVGDHVDILGLFQIEKPGSGVIPSARVVFQNVPVIAVGQFTIPNVIGRTKKLFAAAGESAPETQGFTLTLAMTPFDAQRMILVQEIGKVVFMLRFTGESPEPLQFQILTSEDVTGSEFPVWTPAKKEYNMLERLNRPSAPGR